MVLCAKPPPDLLQKLADMKCAEFIKAKAYLDGEDVSDLRTMTAGKNKPEKGVEQSWDALRQPINDASRYDKDAERCGDVGRLIAVSLATGGVAASFVENPWFRKAIEKLQVGLVGQSPFQVPNRKDIARMQSFESQAALREIKSWVSAVGHVTLAVDGRRMSEGRNKESMLNTAAS